MKKYAYFIIILFILFYGGIYILFHWVYPFESKFEYLYQKKEQEFNVHYVEIDKVSDDFVNAIYITEDRRFYIHKGIDPIGILRAIIVNIKNNQLREGGSSISQQLMKNVYLTHERTFERKVKETILTVGLESDYSKDEILERYINIIYYGNGAYGIYNASQTYFGKEPHELNKAEATLLAGLPNAPSLLNPYENFDLAKNRQRQVLKSLVSKNIISEEEADSIFNQKIILKDVEYD